MVDRKHTSNTTEPKSWMDITDTEVMAEIERFKQLCKQHPELIDRFYREICAICQETLNQEQKQRVARGRRSQRPEKYIHG